MPVSWQALPGASGQMALPTYPRKRPSVDLLSSRAQARGATPDDAHSSDSDAGPARAW